MTTAAAAPVTRLAPGPRGHLLMGVLPQWSEYSCTSRRPQPRRASAGANRLSSTRRGRTGLPSWTAMRRNLPFEATVASSVVRACSTALVTNSDTTRRAASPR